MEKAKYLPDEIDRMIDEEISRIDAANSMAASTAMQRTKNESGSPLNRFARQLRACFKRRKEPDVNQ